FDKLVQTAPVGEGQLQIASRHPKSPKGSHCFFWHVALGNRMYPGYTHKCGVTDIMELHWSVRLTSIAPTSLTVIWK
ncbi:hypothetical protein, partial [Rhizobium leguminosarum]|uniref:hypothetical protein n=1 Tax=Rhizobium leguminosarum TaxID=384 RepID=UPI00198043A3